MNKTTLNPFCRVPFASCLQLNGIVTALFSAIGILLAAQILALLFTGAGFPAERMNAVLNRQTGANWFCSVLFAFTAVAAYSVSAFAARKRDAALWKVFAVFFIFFSVAETGRLERVLGWETFALRLENPWIAALAAAGALLIGGYFLARAMEESAAAARCLILGALLYMGSAFVDYLTILFGQDMAGSALRALQMILQEGIRMLGLAVFLSGILLHEQFLYKQLQRLKPEGVPFVIPGASSERAAWALRMIGTPTRDELLMQEEAERARRRKKDAART